VSERECREQFEKLTLLQTRRYELCHTSISPPRVRHHLFVRMRIVSPHHTEMAVELATLQALVSSTVESTLGPSPNNPFRMEFVGELVVEFHKLEEQCSRLERPAVRPIIWTSPRDSLGRSWLHGGRRTLS
jgi:hypothetical protein